MTERLAEQGIPIFEDAEDTDDEILSAWAQLFTAVTEIAYLEDTPVDGKTTSAYMEIDGVVNPEYEMRLNPAITTDGNLEFLILDIYYQGTHSQQFSAKAVWNEGNPQIESIDNSPIDPRGKVFNLREAASLAENLITKVHIDVAYSGIQENAIFPIPGKYLTSIH